MDKVLAIVGPTGSGKSALAVALAKKLDGIVISGDSMQVYRKMDIGTAKITPEETEGMEHKLIDIQDYDQPYNVKIFQSKAREAINECIKAGKLPILCGGTGLYVKAALYDYRFEEEETDIEYQKQLERFSDEQLYEKLMQVDPTTAKTLHPHNRKRVLRALMMEHTGPAKSRRQQSEQLKPEYDIFFLAVEIDRPVLHQRIDVRVEKMFEQGLVKEAEQLFQDPKTWSYTSFQGIGYKEFKPYFEGTADLDMVKEEIKKHTRQYAKRQITWFKHQMPVHWIHPDDPHLLDEVKKWYDNGRE